MEHPPREPTTTRLVFDLKTWNENYLSFSLSSRTFARSLSLHIRGLHSVNGFLRGCSPLARTYHTAFGRGFNVDFLSEESRISGEYRGYILLLHVSHKFSTFHSVKYFIRLEAWEVLKGHLRVIAFFFQQSCQLMPPFSSNWNEERITEHLGGPTEDSEWINETYTRPRIAHASFRLSCAPRPCKYTRRLTTMKQRVSERKK